MELPFTRTEFLAVFADYNNAIWPLQFALLALALAAAFDAGLRKRMAGRWILALLAGLWLWMGLVYHGVFFRRINPVAVVFAAGFVLQAGLLAWAAVKARGGFRAGPDLQGVLGALIILYALAGYPLLGYAFGHRYPQTPTFGLPCPTTLFTLGMLLWLRPLRPMLFLIPVVWAFIGLSAAFKLGIYQDTGLPVAALAVLLVLLTRRRALEPVESGRSGEVLSSR